MSVALRRPDDFHIHFRDGADLPHYVRDVAAVFGRVLVMPNTDPPIDAVDRLDAYREAIRTAALAGAAAGPSAAGQTSVPNTARTGPTKDAGVPGHAAGDVAGTAGAPRFARTEEFEPLLTFKLTQRTDPELATAMKAHGAVAAKLYPEGATTNSADGVRDIDPLFPVFEALAAEGLVLCIHAEDPDVFVLDREKAYLPRVERIHTRVPSLRIVVEHLSSEAAVRFVEEAGENVAGTITAHHLAMTLDDVLGAGVQPHHYCKPVLKRPEDRRALLRAALSQSKSFFFGSDSAPHPRGRKECGVGAAGVYTAPLSVSVLAEVFSAEADRDWPRLLEHFACAAGADFYGLPHNASTIEVSDVGFLVPEEYHGVVPMFAGRRLRWATVRS